MRLLTRAVEGAIHRGYPGPSPPSDALRIGPEARWFEASGGGRVDLSRRGALRRLLLRLAGERSSAPDRSVSLDELVEAGWPGSRGARESMQRRLYTSLWMLRDLGLRDVLLRRDDGYLLDPAVPLVFPG
jgi:hypothetical protein